MKGRVENPEKERLDGFVVDVEFLLISVIQGGALVTLGAAAAVPLSDFNVSYFPYVASALVFILIFWAQAIVHTISFIKWPMDIVHNLLYFLVGLVEIMAFTQLTNPLRWFGFIFLFFIITGILYIYDLNLIKKQKEDFNENEERKKLYKDIISRQNLELKVFVPLALIYNGLCFWLIYKYPDIFITHNYHVALGLIQLGFGVIFMGQALLGFKKRIKIVSGTISA